MEPTAKCYQSYGDGMIHTRGIASFYIEPEPILYELPEPADGYQGYPYQYYLPIPYTCDCLYDIEFKINEKTSKTPTSSFTLVSIELLQGEQLLSTLPSCKGYPAESPLMLWLLPEYNQSNPYHIGLLQYRINYYGHGVISYGCKHGFLSQAIRNHNILKNVVLI